VCRGAVEGAGEAAFDVGVGHLGHTQPGRHTARVLFSHAAAASMAARILRCASVAERGGPKSLRASAIRVPPQVRKSLVVRTVRVTALR
jgi:hypothetical protein